MQCTNALVSIVSLMLTYVMENGIVLRDKMKIVCINVDIKEIAA
jgi:hypothetical protein